MYELRKSLRRRLILALAALMLAVAIPSPSYAAGYFSGVYISVFGARDYHGYVPTTYRPGVAMPLLVASHGCTENDAAGHHRSHRRAMGHDRWHRRGRRRGRLRASPRRPLVYAHGLSRRRGPILDRALHDRRRRPRLSRRLRVQPVRRHRRPRRQQPDLGFLSRSSQALSRRAAADLIESAAVDAQARCNRSQLGSSRSSAAHRHPHGAARAIAENHLGFDRAPSAALSRQDRPASTPTANRCPDAP